MALCDQPLPFRRMRRAVADDGSRWDVGPGLSQEAGERGV